MKNFAAERIELRCPNGTGKLFAVMFRKAESIKIDPEVNVMEFSCRDCRLYVEKIKGRRPIRVLHYYNILCEHIGDDIVWTEPAPQPLPVSHRGLPI